MSLCLCPVALFGYVAYQVKIVENWWCPFAHDQKPAYAVGAIHKSFWHVDPEERVTLHPDDKTKPDLE